MYSGKTYNKCINVNDPNNRFWCSTKVDTNGNYVNTYWGYCDQNCILSPNEDQQAKVTGFWFFNLTNGQGLILMSSTIYN